MATGNSDWLAPGETSEHFIFYVERVCDLSLHYMSDMVSGDGPSAKYSGLNPKVAREWLKMPEAKFRDRMMREMLGLDPAKHGKLPPVKLAELVIAWVSFDEDGFAPQGLAAQNWFTKSVWHSIVLMFEEYINGPHLRCLWEVLEIHYESVSKDDESGRRIGKLLERMERTAAELFEITNQKQPYFNHDAKPNMDALMRYIEVEQDADKSDPLAVPKVVQRVESLSRHLLFDTDRVIKFINAGNKSRWVFLNYFCDELLESSKNVREEFYKEGALVRSLVNAINRQRVAAPRMTGNPNQSPYKSGWTDFDDRPGDTSTKAMGERIRNLRFRRGLTAKTIASQLGIQSQSVSSWETGKTAPTPDRLPYLANILRCSPEYLTDGTLDKRAAEKEQKFNEESGARVGTAFLNLQGEVETLQKKLEQIAEVPLYRASVSAGSGKITFEVTSEQPLTFRRSFFEKRGLVAANCRCFTVEGDSMEPHLQDGDVVLTGGEPKAIKDGMLYVLRYGPELRVKRLRRTMEGGLVLMSDNPRYPEETISPEQAEQFVTVVGQVFWRGG